VVSRPSVLLHSGGFTSRQWRRLSEALASSSEVYIPDLLGYGASGKWPDQEPFHFEQDLDHLERFIVGIGGAVHLVGHSYGGFLALQLALRRPDLVSSIAAYEPVAFGVLDAIEDADVRVSLVEVVKRTWQPNEKGVDEEWLRAFVEWWNGAGAWERISEDVRVSFREVGWKLFQEVMSLAADRTDTATYAAINVPVLLLCGGESPPPERRAVEKLAAALPRATMQMFPGVGHMGPISHARLINAAIALHLEASR